VSPPVTDGYSPTTPPRCQCQRSEILSVLQHFSVTCIRVFGCLLGVRLDLVPLCLLVLPGSLLVVTQVSGFFMCVLCVVCVRVCPSCSKVIRKSTARVLTVYNQIIKVSFVPD